MTKTYLDKRDLCQYVVIGYFGCLVIAVLLCAVPICRRNTRKRLLAYKRMFGLSSAMHAHHNNVISRQF